MLREKFKVSYVQISLQKRSWPFKKIVNCCLFLEACPGTLSLICSWSIKAKMFIELHSMQCIPTDKTLRISFFRFLEQWDHQWLEMRLLAPLIMVSLKRFKTEWGKQLSSFQTWLSTQQTASEETVSYCSRYCPLPHLQMFLGLGFKNAWKRKDKCLSSNLSWTYRNALYCWHIYNVTTYSN